MIREPITRRAGEACRAPRRETRWAGATPARLSGCRCHRTWRWIAIESSVSTADASMRRAPLHGDDGVAEGKLHLVSEPCDRRRIGQPPMCGHGWPGQRGQTSPAAWSQTVNTKSIWGARRRRTRPSSCSGRPAPARPYRAAPQRMRVDDAGGVTARRVGLEAPCGDVQQGLSQEGTGGVAGADEEDVSRRHDWIRADSKPC